MINLADLENMPVFKIFDSITKNFNIVKLYLTLDIKYQLLGNFYYPPHYYILSYPPDENGNRKHSGLPERYGKKHQTMRCLCYAGYKKYSDLLLLSNYLI